MDIERLGKVILMLAISIFLCTITYYMIFDKQVLHYILR
jgi:hypothetical protein